jgi:hypothetical protein
MLSRKSAPKYAFFYKKGGKKGENRCFSAPRYGGEGTDGGARTRGTRSKKEWFPF